MKRLEKLYEHYMIELRNKGYNDPEALIVAMIERIATNPEYDLLHNEIKREISRQIFDNNEQINNLTKQLVYYYSSNELLTNQLDKIKHESENYIKNREISLLTKKIIRRINMLNFNKDSIEMRCADDLNRMKELDPTFNLSNLMQNVFILKNMSSRQENAIKTVERFNGY
jgi:hypothetical protein